MNRRLLKRVCLFLESQDDNEAYFSNFWDKTKDFYPEDQSKTKVRQWLQEHPECFELVAGKDGNPCSKIRLKVSGSNVEPCTTAEEDDEILSKLIEATGRQENGEFLYAVLCSQKSDFFPSQMQDKKLIRKWFNERGDYFEMVNDDNGGLHSVRVTERAHQKGRKARPKRKPKAKREQEVVSVDRVQEVVSVDRVQETTSTLGKVSQFIERNGGSVAFDLLVQQKGLFPASLRESSSIRSFLANFPSNIQLIDSLNEVILIKPPSSTIQGKKTAKPSLLCAPKLQVPNLTQPNLRREFGKNTESPDKVINFICENGGTVAYSAILKQARELINPSIINNEALFLWLLSNDCHFDMLPNPNGTPYGQVQVKLNIKPRFCHSYVTQKYCSKENCAYLHICKAFFCGQHHSEGICNQSHNIRDQHNAAIINQSPVLRKCSNEVINNVLLKRCFPRVCSEYNKGKQGVCPRKEKCNFLHICGDFTLNQCSRCPLSHNIVDSMHNIESLKKYALLPSPKMSIDMVKTNIAYIQFRKPVDTMQSRPLPKLMNFHLNSHSGKEARQKRSHRRPRTRGGKKTSSSSDKVTSSKPSESATSNSDSNSSSNQEETLSSKFQQTSLKVGNIQQSNLANTSLSGNEKVENWMFNATGGFAGHVESPSRQRSVSLSSSGGSVQSSVVSSQNSFQLTELEKKVFMRVLDKYDGSAPFNQVLKDDLFPPYRSFDVSKWFKDHPNTFILNNNGRGQVEMVNVFSRQCRLCLDYSSNKGCSNQDCRYFHICRSLVEGSCPDGVSCRFNHCRSDRTKQLTKRFNLEELTDAQLCKVLQLSTPNVCNFHNMGGCNRGVNCPNIHVCKKFARGRCPAKNGCRFGHLEAFETPHAKKLLDQYRMGKQKPHYIRKMLLVLRERKTSATTKGDATTTCKDDLPVTTKADCKEKIKVESEQPKICLQFLIGQCSHGKKCKQIHHSMPYLWQYQLVSNPSSKWRKFYENDCENIEKYFCDVNFTAGELSMATKITPQSSTPRSSVQLNFQSMHGSCHNPSSEDLTEFDLRRLETNAKKEADVDWFDAQWMWYKLDDSHQWIKYKVDEVNLLEENYLFGRIQIDSSLRRRPAVFITLSEVQERKRRLTEASVVSEKPIPLATNFIPHNPNVEPTYPDPVMKSSPSSPAPASDQCYKVKVELGTQDYHTIEKLLRDSVGQEELDINNLEKIKNSSLWTKYVSKKKEMTDELDPGESVNERPLFMPCRYDDVERIMKGNVYDSRLVMPNLFGPGHYFTSNASLCLQWCTKNSVESRFLLVCQVLLGTYTEGSSNTQTRPRRENGKFYDSLVDKITEPTVFVVSDVNQCYPAYIIEFSYASTPTLERNDPLSNFDPRDAGRALGTPRQDTFPIDPSYPNYPASTGQNQRPAMVNHPLSTPAVGVTQHSSPPVVPTSPGSRAFADAPRSPAVSPHAPVGHMEDCVKAPPPYSEEVVGRNQGVPSEPPPSYSRHPRPESGFGCSTGTQPVPRRSSRPGGTKKETDCVVM